VDDLGPLVLRAVRLVTVRPDLKPLAEDVEHEEPTLDLDLPDLLRKSCMALAAELAALRHRLAGDRPGEGAGRGRR
jgi:hypothetical protein